MRQCDIAGLPNDDPTLTLLAACPALYNEHIDLWEIPSSPDGEINFVHEEAIHCGPRRSSIAPDECKGWFDEWAAFLIKEAPEMRKEYDEWLTELSGIADEGE